ncbi:MULTISPECIES: DNA-primase RepB domain-containing protein [unclassified Mesorhizobium]|uniref:DNA-primase RepB domain-containing protein n=1 Tax=unclassified Mesorhizobium TaxID=325217 RepID=UPI00333C8F02
MSNLTPDTASAMDFLRRFTPSDRWDLAALPPDGGQPEFRTFIPDEHEQARDWIERRQGTKGLYYHVNRLRTDARNIKAKKPDIVAVRALHVDVDLNDDAALSALREFGPTPTAIVFSGGGYQALWRLTESSTEFDRAERINIWLARQLGGDNCHNIDRLLRLPGTINLPNAKKRAAGRVPVLARVIG